MMKFTSLIKISATALLTLGMAISTGNAAPTTNFTVTKTADNGSSGTLRWAIIQANSAGGANTIDFNIPTSDPNYDSTNGWWTITLTSSLPSLTDNETTINGFTTNTNLSGLEIVIDGSNLGGSTPLLTIASDENTIQALTLAKGPGAGINLITGAYHNSINNNYIGTDPNGLLDWGNTTGIKISSGARSNFIDECIISGNDEDGVLITGSGTEFNQITRSHIGVNNTGLGAIPNGWDGVHITSGANHNFIGAGCGSHEWFRNIISGNTLRGVHISGSGTDRNNVCNAYIGINKNGGASPDIGNLQSGIKISAGAKFNKVGDIVISGNHNHGVLIEGSGTDSNEIIFTIIGANPQETGLIPNHHHGIYIKNGPNLTNIGDDGDIFHNESPVIVGNGWSGIVIENSNSNYINYAYIGVDRKNYSNLLGNKFYGIHIKNSSDNQVNDSHIAYNGTHTTSAGIRVEGSGADGNTISRNSIHDNSGMGIKLVAGANGGIYSPSIDLANCQHVAGGACKGCTLEVFSDDNAEGEVFNGSMSVDPNISLFVWYGFVYGPNVTVTQTDSSGNTSEFSGPWYGACFNGYLPLIYKSY